MKKWFKRLGKAALLAGGGAGGAYYTLKNISGEKGYTP